MNNAIVEEAQPVKVLTIAGSDSGGAAGLQADLKTFTLLGVYGMSVVTAITAQNSVAVTAVHHLPADFVAAQLDAVLSDYGAAAVKTGFIGREELVEIIADRLAAYATPNRLVDPILVNHRGESMFGPDVTEAYRRHLLPLADLLTPNRREAELLLNRPVTTLSEAAGAARRLANQGAKAVLIKRLPVGPELVDLLFDGRTDHYFRAAHIETANTHGSGDMLTAAVTAYRAQDIPLAVAVQQAHTLTQRAIAAAVTWRLGAGHGPVAIRC
jgi:hydroxymethylpyrimidine/phosphomethylpyrimidine kinase